MKISVVIPAFNEEENVVPLAEELDAVRAALPDLEAVFVDDGSTDSTWARIEECRTRFPFVRGIRLPERRGQSSATLLGLRAAAGDVIVTMDGDMQNDPRDLPRLVERLQDCDVACGSRVRRCDSWSRRIGARIGNTVRNWVTHDGIRDSGCSLRAFRRECVADLPPLNGMHRFIPAYFRLNGRRIEQIPVNHRPRANGKSKYTNLKRLPRTVFDLFGFLWYRRRYLGNLDSLAAK